MRCGIALVVRNDVHNISTWIAWHLALGFDELHIFDDYSSDGTWQYLSRAARSESIILSRVASEHPNFQIRQAESYHAAIARAQHLDWLAFLDADEFLSFSDDTAHSFLKRFEAADAIAVNWCMYGSNGLVHRPRMLITDAYTRHAAEGYFPNRHVKTIARPTKIAGKYVNQHAFDIPFSSYLDASGRPIAWHNVSGITSRVPDWSVAKIMHYQCKSMEDFVERAYLRSDVDYSTPMFIDMDRNEVSDQRPHSISGELHRRIREFQHGKSLNPDINFINSKLSAAAASNGHRETGVYLLKTAFDTLVIQETSTSSIRHADAPPSNGALLVMEDAPAQIGYMIPLSGRSGEIRAASEVTPVYVRFLAPRVIALQGALDGLFFRAEPVYGMILDDADQPREWEHFRITAFGGRVN